MAVDPWAGFERDLALITAAADPEAIKRDFVSFAKQSLADVISSGEASPIYDRYVNGRPNLPEEAVQLPGLIVYEFVNWPLVINSALAELRDRSPRGSASHDRNGRFVDSFIVIVDQTVVTDFTGIPIGAEVIITNAQPYIRKVEGGILSVPRGYVFDGAGRAMESRFKNSFKFITRWLNIPQGVDARIPYILKGEYNRRRNAAIANPAKHGRPPKRRKDRNAGDPITYPALVINMS